MPYLYNISVYDGNDFQYKYVGTYNPGGGWTFKQIGGQTTYLWWLNAVLSQPQGLTRIKAGAVAKLLKMSDDDDRFNFATPVTDITQYIVEYNGRSYATSNVVTNHYGYSNIRMVDDGSRSRIHFLLSNPVYSNLFYTTSTAHNALYFFSGGRFPMPLDEYETPRYLDDGTTLQASYRLRVTYDLYSIFVGPFAPTSEPTADPTAAPTSEPTAEPTAAPTRAPCRAGSSYDAPRDQCVHDLDSCNLLLLSQNANQDPSPAVPGTCNAIFAACSGDGAVEELTEAEWDACAVDAAMDPTFVQAFALVDNAPRNGKVSRAEYAAFHRISDRQVEDLVFPGEELALTSFQYEPMTAAQDFFDRFDRNNTGRACCVPHVNGGEPFVLRQLTDFLNGLPAAEAERQLQQLMHGGGSSDLSPRGSTWSSSAAAAVCFGVALVVVLAVIALRRRRSGEAKDEEEAGGASNRSLLTEGKKTPEEREVYV